jgi:hypothetical protein
MAARDAEFEKVKILIQKYRDTYGQRIMHGEAEFNVEGLLRLAGWESDV